MSNLELVECSYGIYERRGLKSLHLLFYCVAEELPSDCAKETMPQLVGFTTERSPSFRDTSGARCLCMLMAGGHAVG